MGKGEKNKLVQCLNSHLNSIHETFQLFDQPPGSALEKVNWDEVLQMGDAISRQATIIGMIWTGEPPLAEEIEENMEAYVNTIQGFLLLAYGATKNAGSTLSSSILESVKKVVDGSFLLLKESIDSFGTCRENDKKIPQLVGGIWASCSALEKIPNNNVTAIGRAITHVAVSVKDVLREMKELKPSPTDEIVTGQVLAQTETELNDDDDTNEADLGNDLSPEEMSVAESAISVVSETLVVIKELIRSITGLLKLRDQTDTSDFVESLENLLKQCRGIGIQIDELGACLYPPQEVVAIRKITGNISSILDEMRKEADNLKGSSESFVQACVGLKKSMAELNSKLEFPSASDLEAKMQKVDLNN